MKIVIGLICGLFILSGCVKNNPDPSWIEIAEWQVIANPNAQYPTGELTEDISQAWVYVDNDLMGVFELPTKIPILKSGANKIQIFPAILNNGISATKKIYPFLEPYELDAELIQNQVLSIQPVTQYYSFTQFWVEDFEDAASSLEDSPTSESTVLLSNDADIIEDFNGNSFARITLTQSQQNWIGSTTGTFNFPKGQEVYLEIDYHNTSRLITGVLAVGQGGTQDHPNIQLNAQPDSTVEWKKIYIDLREIITNTPNTSYYEITFQAPLDSEMTSGEINIDNIKLVHF